MTTRPYLGVGAPPDIRRSVVDAPTSRRIAADKESARPPIETSDTSTIEPQDGAQPASDEPGRLLEVHPDEMKADDSWADPFFRSRNVTRQMELLLVESGALPRFNRAKKRDSARRDAVHNLLANLIAWTERARSGRGGRGVVLPGTASYYTKPARLPTQYLRRWLGFDVTHWARRTLAKADLIAVEVGSKKTHDATYIRPTVAFHALRQAVEANLHSDKVPVIEPCAEDIPPISWSEVRLNSAKDRKTGACHSIEIPKAVQRSDEFRRMERELEAYNRELVRHRVEFPATQVGWAEGDVLTYADLGEFDFSTASTIMSPASLISYRVFSGGRAELDLSGRFYSRLIQQMLSEHRQLLRIDGEPAAQADFQALHPRLLFALAGLPQPEGDLYSVAVPCKRIISGHTGRISSRNPPSGLEYEDYDWIPPRHLAKACLLVAVNGGGADSVLADLEKRRLKMERAFDLEELRAELGLGPGWPEHKPSPHDIPWDVETRDVEAVQAAMLAKHPPIAARVSEVDLGAKMQYLEARIAEHVVRRFTAAQLPVVVVHDGYLTSRSNGEKLRRVMAEAFESVTNQSLSLRYIDLT